MLVFDQTKHVQLQKQFWVEIAHKLSVEQVSSLTLFNRPSLDIETIHFFYITLPILIIKWLNCLSL